jgi:cation diffusion facilitator family transporter
VIMAYESAQRLVTPVEISFGEAIAVAVVGLIVNFVSAWILKDDAHSHGHAHEEHDHDIDHGHAHHHHDHNLRAAYVHVVADALTSVLAIVALVAGLFWGLNWLDPAMGIVGALIIARWAWTLLGTTGRILLDADPSAETTAAVRKAIEADADNRVADLHVWRVGPGHLAAVLTVVTHEPQPPAHYKKLLAGIASLSHVTVEVEVCCGEKPHAA